ncbi:MAG: hypothetical protein IMZ70_05235, partial [Candidatus Atribacteria bacterium]|nr:hypothetical protein [Candidatus Atribacteria bacterium]
VNIVAKTAREQAESQKDLILADPAHKDLAEQVTNAKNMDVLIVKNPNEGVKQVSLGGMNTENLGWMAFVENTFNKAGGTADVMRGGTEAPTLGQEKMMFQNASRIVNNMSTRYHTFMTSILRKLAWRVWTDPTVYIPVIKEIPGIGQLEKVFSQADVVGDFYDFVFNIVPYSTQRMSPELKYQRLLALASQWILPTMQYATQQGAQFDIPEATKLLAEYQGLDNFNQLYTTAMPDQLQGISYQMQPMNGKQSKSPGQGNDSMGASPMSREANSNQQQLRTSGKEETV